MFSIKFPHFKQYDAKDCGPTCLRMIAKYYGQSYPMHFLRNISFQKRTGTTFLGLRDAGEAIGLKSVGVKISFDQLSKDISLPCIIQWNQVHFVVVYKVENNKIIVGDPAQGILTYDKSAFLKCWQGANETEPDNQGYALLIETTEGFYKNNVIENSRRFNLLALTKYLRPYSKYVFQIIISLLFASIINLVFPVLTKAIVDTGIGNSDISFVVAILIAQISITIGQSFNELIKNWLMLHVSIRVSITLISDFLSKMMRLPISFFDTKKTGDLLQRIKDFSRVQEFLTGSLISIIMAVIGFAVYVSIVASYNLLIFVIFLFGSVLYVLWVMMFLKRRRKLDYMRFQESASNQSNIIQLISGMQEIKLNTCEKQKRWEWEKIQLKLFDIEIKGLTLSQTQEIGGIFIDQIKNVLISFLAARAVINNNMTLGMMMALQYIVGQLNAPVRQFISFIQSTQDTKISLERLNEIKDINDEDLKTSNEMDELPFNADIQFKNVDFQYDGPSSPKVLNNVNIIIEANKVTAIVGTSGSGKTTLLKLMLGFYEPANGNIIMNGLPLTSYNKKKWRRNCGVVMQEGFIFSDTISNNIGVVDESVDIGRVKFAAKIANMDAFIESLPQGYNTQIGAEGEGLSTGQKQRILIARAIYKDAKFIMFDEATNALDANNEMIIMNNLNKFFVNRTVVIVAHRLSTVKNADKIIVIHQGKIVEQGTHNELVSNKGDYYNLVKNQLELGN